VQVSDHAVTTMAVPGMEALVAQLEGLFQDQNRRTEMLAEYMVNQKKSPEEEEAARRKEATRVYSELSRQMPTYERGKDRWIDFAERVVNLFEVYEVRPAQAKMLLWNAVIGRSSKIVVASMNPSKAPYLTMSFANYLDEMKGKFTPATESLQMKAEYQNRKQTKQEDIQNYINEKYSECECMAMHEQGFRGPCFYCQRKGHMVRNCPRKSAGLPKVKVSEMNMGARPKWKKGVTPKGQMGNRRDGKPNYKKVNHLEEGGDDEEVDEDDGDDVADQDEQDGEVSFLGEAL